MLDFLYYELYNVHGFSHKTSIVRLFVHHCENCSSLLFIIAHISCTWERKAYLCWYNFCLPLTKWVLIECAFIAFHEIYVRCSFLFFICRAKVLKGKSKFAVKVAHQIFPRRVFFSSRSAASERCSNLLLHLIALPHWPDASCLDSLLCCAVYPQHMQWQQVKSTEKRQMKPLSSSLLWSSFWWYRSAGCAGDKLGPKAFELSDFCTPAPKTYFAWCSWVIVFRSYAMPVAKHINITRKQIWKNKYILAFV